MICAREGCENEVVKKSHNQKFCGNECCRIATNARLMERYHEKKSIRAGKKRKCKECGSPLSRYNDNKVCNACIAIQNGAGKKELIGMLSNVIG